MQQWLRTRGVFLHLLGLDSMGRPIVVLGNTLADLAVVTGQDSAQTVADGTREVTFSLARDSLVADPDGFWFVADEGVFRYTASGGVRKVWNNPTNSPGILVSLAGPCA